MWFGGWPFRSRPVPFGREAEIRGARYLRSRGLLLVACPFEGRGGEIDIVARDLDCLVFVEVKARRRDPHPEDAVTGPKRRRIIRAANQFRHQYGAGCRYRFDILSVTLTSDGEWRFEHFPDAFGADSPGSWARPAFGPPGP
jgi:putative endonuclease